MKPQKFMTAALGLVLVAMIAGTAQSALVIPTVLVGDAGNSADSTGFGAVSYEYQIGKYEVTLAEYTAFLNAVAATDTYNLYMPNMATDLNIAGISRSGSSGSYSYSVIGGGNRPVTWVSWFDAARFANWMNNGATIGASTETGAYTLNGATSGVILKNPGASWWIPSENEWYKAAYYKGGGTNAGYWQYPTQSNSAPGNIVGSGVNQANYAVWNGSAWVYSVTQSSYSGGQNYLTDGGAYSISGTYYGTYDQGGNVAELNDAVIFVTARGVRGGSWLESGTFLQSSERSPTNASNEYSSVGFRLATVAGSSAVPESGQVAASGVLLVGGGLYWLVRRRKAKA
jgi:sulfatase modifying factor 1